MAEAAGAAGVVLTIVKYGPAAIDFIHQLNDKTVVMKCQFPTDPSSNTIVFEAFDNRSFLVKLVATPVPPWGTYTGPFDFNETPPKSEPDRFEYIEIECNDKDQFRELMGKYQGRSEIPQAEVIDRLKIVNGRFCKISKMKAVLLPIRKAITGGGGMGGATVPKEVYKWWVWKLQVVIDPNKSSKPSK